jgi:hypothetical protein
LGASPEAALSAWGVDSQTCIGRRSYRRRPETTYQRSIQHLTSSETAYGPDGVDNVPRAASYVDRILRGEKPGDLPVQFPTKYEMVVNF